ncbi:hypothetical protein skT53_07450 [Effusibacillus dendaii]|uniref:RNHCP domain-containing protein n=1 Tax=Effusibacillus dendaii TaxID=2743772 RepID=A0A7I8DB67_9BACL|nr:hypothetical protein skT53_07450 [Effusibacillus dendaii]
MHYVCPICNGIRPLQMKCPRCQMDLENNGPLTDFVGPYSPYELSPRMEKGTDQCLHLLSCPMCGNESYAFIQNDVI